MSSVKSKRSEQSSRAGQDSHPPNRADNLDSAWRRLLRHNVRHRWLIWLSPIVGLLSLVWFLARVIPKPSRAAYPCQRVALPLASGFVVWLLGLAGSVVIFRKAKRCLVRARYIMALMCAALSVGVLWLALSGTEEEIVLAAAPTPNVPIGVAQGVHPGRVVWIHELEATDWAGYFSPEHWYDDAHTDQAVVDKMVSRAIRALAGESSDEAAWDAIFRHFNRGRGKGDIGYTAGEKIAMKINNTLCHNASSSTFEQRSNNKNRIDNSPQLTIALLWQLVHVVGVAERDITIGDPGRITPNFYYNIVHSAFPNVCYMANLGGRGRTQATFSSVEFHWSTPAAAGKKQDYIPRSFAEADYFINFPILKSHDSGGITVCGKNHYGSLLRNPNGTLGGQTYNYYNMHDSLPRYAPGMGRYRCLVDLMGHAQLGGKTLLYIVDGLFAGENWDSNPTKWQMPPFNGDWPSSVFVSQDPVAMDSVCFDFLWTEWSNWPHISGADDYLHEAAMADAAPSGTFYDPEGDGIRLTSLGVHEHWNNWIDKQYSRNLGTGDGIELTKPAAADFEGDGAVNSGDLKTLTSQWLQGEKMLTGDIAPYPSGDGIVNLADFALFARYWRE